MTASPITKLIKSSIYFVNGKVCRYTGDSLHLNRYTIKRLRLRQFAFKAHAETFTARRRAIGRASKEQIAAYFGK